MRAKETPPPANPARIAGRPPQRSARPPQMEDVRKNKMADDAKKMPTWNSLRPVLRPNRPTVDCTVAFPNAIAKTGNRTTIARMSHSCARSIRKENDKLLSAVSGIPRSSDQLKIDESIIVLPRAALTLLLAAV